MHRLLRALGRVLLVLALALAGAGVAARFSDGPLGPFPGGPFESGEEAAVPEDWSGAAELREIELQLLEPARSRTTWLVVHEGSLYVPCGFLSVPFLKQWPHQAVRDGRAVLRVEGRRYAGRLVRVEEPTLFAELSRLSSAKYGFGEDLPPDPEQVWFFRFEPSTS
jgi:hypothetical protein